MMLRPIALLLFLVLSACSEVTEVPNSGATNDFKAALKVLRPGMTIAQAEASSPTLSRLRPDDPSEWDGSIGDVSLYAKFLPDGTLAIGRVGIEGADLSKDLVPHLTALHGEPEIIHDTWRSPEDPSLERSEIKWAFPGDVALIWHSAYPGDATREPMPPHTVVRL